MSYGTSGITGTIGVSADTIAQQDITFTWLNGFSVTQGTWTRSINSGHATGGFIRSTTTAQNDEITFNANLKSGTYDIYALGSTDGNCGIMHIYVGGTDVSQIDWYSASITDDVEKTDTSVSIASDGNVSIALKMESKNASSSAYKLTSLQAITFHRTGA